MTQTGLSLGTPQYMSPEQAMGERVIDARSDMYALAAVSYEMLTGEPPFTGASVQAIVARILTESPRAIAPQRKAVPESVEAAVLRALEKLPADRFTDVSAFLAALDAARPVTRAGGSLTTPRAAAAVRQRTAIVVTTTLMAFAAAGGWWLGQRGHAATAGAAISLNVVLPDSTVIDPLRRVAEGNTMIALSPDGEQLAVAALRAGHDMLFVRKLSDFTMRGLPGTDGATSPFYAPTGDAIAFYADSALKTVSLADGRVRVVRTGFDHDFGGAWLRDGRFVLSVSRATRLVVLSPAGDSLRQIACSSPCSYPTPLSDGHRFLLGGGAALRIIDLNTGVITPITRGTPPVALRGMMPHIDGRGHLVYVTLAGSLVAVPFDETSGTVTGDPMTIADSVRLESGRGAAQFALSSAGTIALVTGADLGRGLLVRSDRAGHLDTVPAPPANYLSFALSPDGKRVASRVRLPNGNYGLQIVELATGKVTPWFEAPFLVHQQWTADGRRLLVDRDSDVVTGDPDVATPPRDFVRPPRVRNLTATEYTAGLAGYAHDSLLLQFLDGRPTRAIAASPLLNAFSTDLRWMAAEEIRDGKSSLVARALDGTGRRILLNSTSRMGQVSWPAGGSEFIAAENEVKSTDGSLLQGFWSIAYNPASPEKPFSEPKFLFRVPAADFPGRNYDVGLGGRLFVFKQSPIIPPIRDIRVIRGWSATLAAPARR